MSGGDKGDLEGRRPCQSCFNHDALGVNANGDDFSAGGDKAVSCANRAGVFKPDPVAVIKQHVADKLKGMLRPARYKNLFGLALDAPAGVNMRSDGRS